MKNRIYTSLILLFALFVTSSCFQDKSSLDTNSIDEIVIEATDMPDILRVDYLGEVNFEPTVKMGGATNPENLTYLWEINQTPGKTEMVELGNERVLNTTITNQILPAAYTLVLTVRDEQHGLEYQRAWPLYVSSAFREGIVVAHTRDGQSSDLNLIMDDPLTTAYDKGENIVMDIWETSLGETRPALIESIEYTLHKPTAILTKNLVTAIYEDNNIEMIDCEDYSLYKNADQIFPGRTPEFNPQSFRTINNGYWVLIANNKPYVYGNNQGITAFMLPVSGVEEADNAVVVADNSQGVGPYAIWYDQETGGMYSVNMTFTTPAMGGAYTNQGAFDPQNISNRSAIAGDISMDGATATMLMKDNNTGNYELYGVSFPSGYQDPSAPEIKVVLPGALTSIIEDAVSVFFNMFDPVMFVATTNKVYAVNFGGGVVSYQEVYSVSSGEIAQAKLFVQGRFRLNQDDFDSENGPIYEDPLELNTNAIVLAVNESGGNGRIEVIPQSSTSTGTLNTADKLNYTGFGEILDFTFQGQ
jgi:hypothetical protein